MSSSVESRLATFDNVVCLRTSYPVPFDFKRNWGTSFVAIRIMLSFSYNEEMTVKTYIWDSFLYAECKMSELMPDPNFTKEEGESQMSCHTLLRIFEYNMLGC